MEAGAVHVVHLGKYYPPASGGIERHVQTLARAQAALGARVEVLCVNHVDGSGGDVVTRTLARTPASVSWDGPVRVVRVGRVLSLRRLDVCPGLLEQLQALRRSPPDVLHLHTPNATMLLALAALPPFSTRVVTHHSDVVTQRVLRHALWPFERLEYGRAARVLVTSEGNATGSPTLEPFQGKLDVLHLGAELGPYLEPTEAVLGHARSWREATPGPLWLMVGRLVHYKGLEVALRALRQVRGTLLVVGTGPLRDALVREARVLGVAQRVRWAGSLGDEELAGAYRAATALWFPSTTRSEAFGLVQVEAMASGLPVINTHIPGSGVHEVSLHGVTGLTVPVADANALAAAARRLLEEEGLRERLGAAAVERARGQFSARRMAERSLALYAAARRREQPPSGGDPKAVQAA